MESGTSFKISTNRHNKKSSMRKKHTRFKAKSISKNIENKKFFHNFFNINLSISFNYPSVKKITNQYIKNLFKSFENKSKKYLCGAVL